ncbi:MAG: hypothetical protein K8J08_14350 [Thermoanaerobaculia bacterium]|nr:hypothetical protein [Thermoanaerobaculia bacterium]
MLQTAETQDIQDIQNRIKRVISHVTNIPADSIANDASFKDDLQLDSLAMLEIAVDVDYEFRLGIQDLEDRIGELSSVQHVADLVANELASRN